MPVQQQYPGWDGAGNEYLMEILAGGPSTWSGFLSVGGFRLVLQQGVFGGARLHIYIRGPSAEITTMSRACWPNSKYI